MRTRARTYLLAIAGVTQAACSDSSVGPGGQPLIQSPGAARDTISVVSWRRSNAGVSNSYFGSDARTLSAVLAREVSGISAINPRTGTLLWTASLPSRPSELRTRGTVIRAVYTAVGGASVEVFLDEATGAQLWSQDASALPGRRLITASATTILETLGDTAFIGRDRTSGQVRWIRSAAIGTCTGRADDCILVAGERATTFLLIRPTIGGSAQRLFSVTESGDVSVSTFSDPFSSVFAIFSDVTTDSASTRIFLASLFSAFALDASTGVVRWSVRHPFTFDGSTLEAPIVSTLRGATPLVDLFYRYDTPTSPAFAREVVRDLTTGTVVRETVRSERADQVAYIGQCGDDGIVIVRTTGRFLFSNIRTGVNTEGIIREPTSSATVILSQFDDAASSFAGGYLVFLTSNGVLGFKCHP